TTLAPAGKSPAAKRDPFYESERELRDTHMNRRWISQVIVASSLASSPLLSQALTSNASLVTTPQPRAVIAGLAGNWRFDLYQLGHTSPVASRLSSDSWISRTSSGLHRTAAGAWYSRASAGREIGVGLTSA